MALHSLYSSLFTLSAVLSFATAIYTLRHSQLPEATAFALLLGSQGLWALANLLQLFSPELRGQLLWDSLALLATDLAINAALSFALTYSGHEKFLRRYWFWLLLFPALHQVMIWSDGFHGLLRLEPRMDSSAGFAVLLYARGPWLWLSLGYNYLLMVAAMLVLARSASRAARHFRVQAWMLVLGLALPSLGVLLGISGLVRPFPFSNSSLDFTPIWFLLAYPILAWSLLWGRVLEILPVAYDMLFEALPESVIVLDRHQRIIAANRQARHSFGLDPRRQPALAVALPALRVSNSACAEQGAQQIVERYDARGVVSMLELTVTPLRDRRHSVGGQLLLIRDVTARWQAEQALRLSERDYKTLAFEHARLYEEAQRRSEQTETLRLAAATVAESLDMQETVERILEQLARVVPYDSASVQLRRGNDSEIFGCRGFAHPERIIGIRLPILSDSLCRAVYLDGKTKIVDDIRMVSDFVYIADEPIRSWLGLPMIVGERVLGMLALRSARLAHFNAEHARLGMAFATQVAIALEHGKLYQREVRARARLVLLQQAAREIAAHSATASSLYQAVYQATTKLMPAEVFVIVLFEGALAQAVYVVHHGQQQPGKPYPRVGSFADLVVQRGSALRLGYFATFHTPELSALNASGDICSGLAVPLWGRAGPLGVIFTQSATSDPYSDEDATLLELLAAHVATALENSVIFARIERLATLDSLTGLSNRRHFFVQAQALSAQALCQARPLAVILLDLDYFKQVNDTYGHQAGDEVLRMVAQTCRRCLRADDLLARYGGEELAFLMPNTGPAEAVVVAERLCQAIADLRVAVAGATIRLTASLGVAAETSYCGDLDAILGRADTALYQAKAAGRNRVACASETPAALLSLRKS